MSTIVSRATKGSPLTNTEVDSNFSNLHTDKIEVTGTPATGDRIQWDGTKWLPSRAVSILSGSIGNGSAVTFTITHNLNTTSLLMAFRDSTTGYPIYCDWYPSSANAIIVNNFGTAPATGSILYTLMG